VGLLYDVAQWTIAVDLVVVAPTDPSSRHISFSYQVSNDCLGGTLGDPDPLGNVSAPDPWIGGNAYEHMAVVR